jgi:pSer/pThr/pTyr-binding forkhead associated (FHA) protein
MTGKILVRTAEGVLQEFPLGASLRVGSGPASDLVIEGDGVLPEHAKVGVTEQGGWIEAVGGSRVSINGEPADRRALHHLDVITLGDHVHAIFLTSPDSLRHASRPRQAVSSAVLPSSPSPTKTIVALPIGAVFTPPVDDQPAASSPGTVVGLPVGGLFTPPADDRSAPAAETRVGIPAVPAVMPGDSSSTRTVAGLPLSDLTPPQFGAPPSQTIKISPVAPPAFTPDRPAHPIRSVRLSGADGVFEAPLGVSVIGRGSKSTVRIDSAKISRVHAVVTVSREGVTIEDQGSANGTSVNGVRITGRHVLADGDLLSLGTVELRVAFIRHAGDK